MIDIINNPLGDREPIKDIWYSHSDDVDIKTLNDSELLKQFIQVKIEKQMILQIRKNEIARTKDTTTRLLIESNELRKDIIKRNKEEYSSLIKDYFDVSKELRELEYKTWKERVKNEKEKSSKS